MVFENSIAIGQLIILNGLFFIVGVCCVIMGLILFVMTLMGLVQKKSRGIIKEIKQNMVSKTAIVELTDEQGTREVEAELRSKSKIGDRISVVVEKKTGKLVEFNAQRLMVVGMVFLAVGLLIILPGILMNT